MDDILLIFAKAPRPGAVKTRLTPFLTSGEAARLYDAFLRDALHLYARMEVDLRLYLAPPLPDERLEDVPSRISIHSQEGDGLGARMSHAFEAALRAGYDRATVIGTDHPTLPLAFVRRAFTALGEDRSVCIGPSADGGFYLLGMSTFFPELFEGMTYSHEAVFRDTLARARAADAEITVLPRWYDVDRPEDLSRLLDDLSDASTHAPRTRRMIDRLALADRLERIPPS